MKRTFRREEGELKRREKWRKGKLVVVGFFLRKFATAENIKTFEPKMNLLEVETFVFVKRNERENEREKERECVKQAERFSDIGERQEGHNIAA